MAYLIGGLIGGLIATFLVRGLLLLVIPRSDEAPIMRYVVANALSFLVAMSLYAFGSADGGPPNWGGGFLVYIVPQAIWLGIDVMRAQSARTTAAAIAQAAPAMMSPASAARNPDSSSDKTKTGAPASPAASSAEPSQGELAFWQSVKDSPRASDFEAYLRQFPQGLFRLIARHRLIALGGSPPPEEIAEPLKGPPAAVASATSTNVRALRPEDVAGSWGQIENSIDAGDYNDFAAVFPGTSEAFQALRRTRQLRAWAELDRSAPDAIDAFLKSDLFPALQEEVHRFIEIEAHISPGVAALVERRKADLRDAQLAAAKREAMAAEEQRLAEEARQLQLKATKAKDDKDARNAIVGLVLVLVVIGGLVAGYAGYDAIQRAESEKRASQAAADKVNVEAAGAQAEAIRKRNAEVARETLWWRTMTESASIASLQAYLKEFPSGAHASEARSRMAALQSIRDGGEEPSAAAPLTSKPDNEKDLAVDLPPPPWPIAAIELDMVTVPSGRFLMGSESGDYQQPVRWVSVPSFRVSKFEVTWLQWQECVRAGSCPSVTSDVSRLGTNPAEGVSWTGAKAFVAWLRAITGRPYRLLSEAEWEYAARAGTTSKFPFGASANPTDANLDFGNASGTVPVGQYAPNGFGLYDMIGNVSEWVEDCFEYSYAAGQPSNGSAHVHSPCAMHVVRGGSWATSVSATGSAERVGLNSNERYASRGFRVAADR